MLSEKEQEAREKLIVALSEKVIDELKFGTHMIGNVSSLEVMLRYLPLLLASN